MLAAAVGRVIPQVSSPSLSPLGTLPYPRPALAPSPNKWSTKWSSEFGQHIF